MKARNKITSVALIIFSFCLLAISHPLKAQEKFKARLSVDHYNVVSQRTYLLINAKYKFEKKYIPADHLQVNIYEEINEDSLAFVGQATTNAKGNAEFDLAAKAKPDSVVKHKYIVKIEKDEKFKNGKKAVSFMDANIMAKAIVEDSINYISASLTNVLGNPVEGEKLEVKVLRLFAPIDVGKSSYKTDDDGNIRVAIENPLPGIDGNLDFEIMMDSKKYGIVKFVFTAPIGKVVVDESTFDKRTMWSPPGKTPIFLFLFANFIIFGIWAVIIILVRNLFKISKS